MSWYRHAVDYVKKYQTELSSAQPVIPQAPEQVLPIQEPDSVVTETVLPKKAISPNLEDALNSKRKNTTENPYLLNEVKQPVRVKATGQGGDAMLQVNKDYPAYGDNFIGVTDWNSN